MLSFLTHPQSHSHNCHYCATQFNTAESSPYFICSNYHQICLHCLNSLQNPSNCRVCRLPIDFNKIRPNKELLQNLNSFKNVNYVKELLGAVPNQQNNRFSAQHVSNHSKHPKVGAYSVYDDINAGRGHVNNHPSTITPIYQDNLENSSHESGCNCCNCLKYWISEGKDDCIYMFNLPSQKQWNHAPQYLLVIQLVMSIINFIIASNRQPSQCLDYKLGTGQLKLRDWYVMTFYCDLFILIGIFPGFLLFYFRCIQHKCFDSYLQVLLVLSMGKLLIWGVLQIDTFIGTLSKVCNGGLYAYGLVTTIFHIPYVLGLLCIIFCLSLRSRTF